MTYFPIRPGGGGLRVAGMMKPPEDREELEVLLRSSRD